MQTPPRLTSDEVAEPASQLSVGAVTALPARLAVGGGTALFVDGRCSAPGAEIEALELRFDGVAHPVAGWGMPLPDQVEGDSYWWAIVPVGSLEAPRRAWVELYARLADGGRARGRLGTVELLPELPHGDAEVRLELASEPEVVICMATHEPPLELLHAQVDSIRAQTHRSWACLVTDDASSPDALEGIREAIDGDGRFLLLPCRERLGFYGNFERALSLVPAGATYVALSDQDDRWRPDKLERLIAGLAPDAGLVYSDMRIVAESGELLSDTYWQYRRNNHTDFASLLLANTVTGAAALLRRELLDDVLPFPPRQGNGYHDHWIAQVALALGPISYVDEPLYDYVQHGRAEVGHLRANNFGRHAGGPIERLRGRVERLRRTGLRPGWRAYYFNLVCRATIAARALELRLGDRLTPDRREAISRVAGIDADVPWLLARSARTALGANETLGREGAMLRGLAWRRISELRRRARARGEAIPRPGSAAPAPAAEPAGRDPEEGQAPLKPILVDYFSRDGSTLLMGLLASSPQIAVEPVYPFERKYFAYLWRWAQVIERGDWPGSGWGPEALGSLDELRDAALVGPLPWQPRRLIDPAPGGSELAARAFELVWAEFSERAAAATRRQHGGSAPVLYAAEKHMNTWLVPLEQLPPLELIVLLRDPRDSFVSINAFGDRGGGGFGGKHGESPEGMLAHVIDRQRERLRWIAALLEGGEVPVVRYEDLVRDLDGVAARLGERLGVGLDPARVEADRRTRERHRSSSSAEASIGRWRAELDPEVAKRFAGELGEELREVGLEV